MAKVLLAMSGGVDSSVAGHLLRERGHEVVGVFMRHGEHSPARCASQGGQGSGALPVVDTGRGHKQGCCSATDAQDARRVADHLGIPFYALDLEEEFGRIIDYFVDEYTAGRTPNPCVMCNNWIKFGKLFEYADSVGAEFVATGHYARLTRDASSGPRLRRGRDRSKDQSYVLFGVARDLLERMRLPVGQYRKDQIRALARQLGLRVAEKRDSQEICFVTSGHHGPFVEARRGARDTAGEVVTTAGKVVGAHPGIERFTIGQRKGLGVALGEPYFVVRIDAPTGRVIIGPRDELARTELYARRANWLVDPPDRAVPCEAQIRYNSKAVSATVQPLDRARLRVQFDQPRYAIAPGQAVVCYDDDRVLCGGWIE
jgi:tRNA-specific 2-thiouridylase